MSTNKRSIDPAIIAALIGVMGTLCVTVITIYVNRFIPQPQPTQPGQPSVLPTWTIPPTATNTFTPVPTDTVPVGEATSTALPDTPTPQATFTPAPPAIGADWANGCISVLWKPYPSAIQTSENNGCLIEPVNVFFAADGRLTFLVSGHFDNDQVYGLFAPLPASGTVSINTFLRTIQVGEIWMGVFAEPDIQSQGTVISIPPGNVRQRTLVQLTMPDQNQVKESNSYSRNPPLYDVVFQYGNGEVRAKIMGDTELDPVPMVSAQPWFFVGYRVKNGNNRIDAEFLNLAVQGQ